jgi:hypothetical protein
MERQGGLGRSDTRDIDAGDRDAAEDRVEQVGFWRPSSTQTNLGSGVNLDDRRGI